MRDTGEKLSPAPGGEGAGGRGWMRDAGEKLSPTPGGAGAGGRGGIRDTGYGMMERRLPPASAETWQIFYKSVRIPFYIR